MPIPHDVGLAVDPAEGSLDAIADHYHGLQVSTRAFIDRAAVIKNLAEESRRTGVIIWLIEEEDALIWDLPAEMSALQASGIAVLRLVRRRWDCATARSRKSKHSRVDSRAKA